MRAGVELTVCGLVPRFRSAFLHFVVVRADDGAVTEFASSRNAPNHDFRTCPGSLGSGMTQLLSRGRGQLRHKQGQARSARRAALWLLSTR